MEISREALSALRNMQRNEITEYHVYSRIAERTKDEENKKVLLRIAAEEKVHAEVWKKYTKDEHKPNMFRVRWYSFLARVFGITFALKRMESGEDAANQAYTKLISEIPEAKRIADEEDRHEQELLSMLDEERLRYVGSMVLGLNDALVELTGTLAGLTFALANTKLVALSGLITGISATLSMASSEYLSARSEGRTDALKSCVYTGIAYLVTVALLVLPYLIFDDGHHVFALMSMLVIVVLIIMAFNYYISVAQDLDFKRRFFEMAGISLSVAAISFVIGLLVKQFLGVDV
jgi:VIT1/CCC1 family predicted Fe2+/Mn2+ transporter